LAYMCYYHANLPAVMVCSRCGRRICSSCSKPYGELALCPSCYHATVTNQPPTTAAPPPIAPALYAGGVPPGGVIYGPYPKPHKFRPFSWIAVVLLLISAALIFANAAALLWPGFFAMWVAFFPWVASLGNFNFILGVVLGLIILGAVFLYMLGFRVLSTFMVFPAAIVSLFIGGGFVVGLVIGVLTGIYMLMTEKRWHP